MGSADYLRLGDWNARCDRCGRKMKGSQLVQTWQGYWVCPEHWEPRQPQDFVRGIVEHPTPPFVRNPPDIFLSLVDPIVNEDYSVTKPDTILLENGDYFVTES